MRLKQICKRTIQETNWIEHFHNRDVRVKVQNGDELSDPEYVYRYMSREEFTNAKRQGAFHPGRDGRIHASQETRPQYKNSPDDVLVRFKYDPRDDWRAKWGGDELYVITNNPIPFERAQLVETNLNEVHYTDMFGEKFENFHKKYRNLVRRKEINPSNYYVQFTNYKDNTLDRTAFDNPDHSDPMGIYAYPLSYVLSHPADIWYGASAKYLRVIQSTAKNPLFVKEIRNWEIVTQIIRRMGIDDPERTIRFAKKRYRHTGRKAPMMTLFSAFQIDFTADPTESWGAKEWPSRPAKEQTELLLRAGYDAVIDEGTGAVNEREPEQAIFLTRASFRVEEVFELHKAQEHEKSAMTASDPNDDRVLMRKFAQMIADQIDDKLKGPVETANLMGWKYFWTNNGRRIEVVMNRPDSYYDRRIGQKPHKYDKKSTNHIVEINVYTEYGKIERRWKSGDMRLKDMAEQIGRDYNKMKQSGSKIPNWKPEDKDKFAAKMEQARTMQFVNQDRKKRDMEPISYEEYAELKANGYNHLGQKFDDAKLQADQEDLKAINHALFRDGLDTMNLDEYRKYEEIVRDFIKQNKFPPTILQFYERVLGNFIDYDKLPIIPHTFVIDLNYPYYMDDMEQRLRPFLEKLKPGLGDEWERVFNGFSNIVGKSIRQGKEEFPSLIEYLRAMYGNLPKNESIIKESMPRTLYHGTSIDAARSIQQDGYLYPSIGNFVQSAYGDEDYDDLMEPLVFATGRDELKRASNAMVYHIGAKLGRRQITVDEIVRYGALVVMKHAEDEFRHKDPDDVYDDDHPHTVEPGDFYSDLPVRVTHILTGKKLRNFLARNGAMPTPKSHGAVMERREIAGAAYLHIPTGKIIGPSNTHYSVLQQIMPKGGFASEEEEDEFYDDIYSGDWVDGFLTSDGKFLSREEAAKAVKLKPDWNDGLGEPDRDWLDSEDVNFGGFRDIHEDIFGSIVSESENLSKLLVENTEYRWVSNIQQRLGGQAGTIVAKADFHLNNTTWTVEIYQIPGWLMTSLGLDGEVDHVYQVGFRDAQDDGYEGDIRGVGRNDAIPIIRTVTKIVIEWISKNRPEIFVAGSPDPQKFRIFKAVANKVKDQMEHAGYNAMERPTPVGDAIIIYQEDLLESVISEEEYWGSAGAGCLIMARDTGRILIPHRSSYVNEGDTWGVWGGAIDPGEKPIQAVKREVEEESGLPHEHLDIVPLYVYHDGDFKYHNFLAIVDNEFQPKLNWETQDYEWVDFGDWPRPMHFGLQELLQHGPSVKIIQEAAKKYQEVTETKLDARIQKLKTLATDPRTPPKERVNAQNALKNLQARMQGSGYDRGGNPVLSQKPGSKLNVKA